MTHIVDTYRPDGTTWLQLENPVSLPTCDIEPVTHEAETNLPEGIAEVQLDTAVLLPTEAYVPAVQILVTYCDDEGGVHDSTTEFVPTWLCDPAVQMEAT